MTARECTTPYVLHSFGIKIHRLTFKTEHYLRHTKKVYLNQFNARPNRKQSKTCHITTYNVTQQPIVHLPILGQKTHSWTYFKFSKDTNRSSLCDLLRSLIQYVLNIQHIRIACIYKFHIKVCSNTLQEVAAFCFLIYVQHYARSDE